MVTYSHATFRILFSSRDLQLLNDSRYSCHAFDRLLEDWRIQSDNLLRIPSMSSSLHSQLLNGSPLLSRLSSLDLWLCWGHPPPSFSCPFGEFLDAAACLDYFYWLLSNSFFQSLLMTMSQESCTKASLATGTTLLSAICPKPAYCYYRFNPVGIVDARLDSHRRLYSKKQNCTYCCRHNCCECQQISKVMWSGKSLLSKGLM